MAVDCRPGTPDDITERVLRRAEVAKMARKLQDRLALANYKTKHGLDNLSFSLVEAHFDNDLSRRRAASGSVLSSGSSSSCSEDMVPYTQTFLSSPVGAPMFSDPLHGGDSGMGSRKRARFQAQYSGPTPRSSVRKSRKNRVAASNSSPIRRSRPQQHLTASSPLEARFHSGFRTVGGPEFSFSKSSALSDSPQFGSSDTEAACQPTIFHGSPPRTPPPTRTRGLRSQKNGVGNGEEGADLLLYLATSPSPAQARQSAPRIFPPSTPPSNPAALPSSTLFTGFSTPGQQFNFSDFVNVTPSPAQGAFNRTPGPAKTPLAAREARRRLNFDSLMPPSSSPNLSRGSGGHAGLGMELGGSLGS